jgi:hypothetical protein
LRQLEKVGSATGFRLCCPNRSDSNSEEIPCWAERLGSEHSGRIMGSLFGQEWRTSTGRAAVGTKQAATVAFMATRRSKRQWFPWEIC